MIETAIAAFQAGLSGLSFLRNRQQDSEANQQMRRAAISAVRLAAVKTKAYVYERQELNDSDRETERELSAAWMEAAGSIEQFSKDLFQRTQAKAIGWADPREWTRIRDQGIAVDIDSIIAECERLLAEDENEMS